MKIGDIVRWTSQSQGSSTTKEGEVFDILPTGSQPSKEMYPILWKGVGPGSGRNKESYIVKVGSKFYWPIASKLEIVQPK